MSSLFYFTPTRLPDSNAASVRNEYFIKCFQKTNTKLNIHTFTTNFFMKPFSNKSSNIKRLLGEILCGVELFLRCLLAKDQNYFFSSPPYLTILIGSWGPLIKGKKYFLDIRDIYPEVYFEMGLISPQSLLGKIFIKLTRYFYEKASLVSVSSEGQESSIKKIAPSANTMVIYNGYDPDVFQPQLKPKTEFSVIFHGNLGKFQKIDLVLEVAKLMSSVDPGVTFFVIGEGPGEVLIKNASLKNVTYLGKIPYHEIPLHISSCHLGLSFRSDDEISKTAMPVKIFEYIGMEIPFILTPKGEAALKFDQLNLGSSFENDQIKDIVNEILKYKNDISFYNERKINIQKNKNLFSREINAKKLTDRINNMIKN